MTTIAEQEHEELAAKVRVLPVWEHVKKGDLHFIELEHVEAFLQFFEKDGDGFYTFDALDSFCKIEDLGLLEEDLRNLLKEADTDDTERVTAEALHKAMTEGETAFLIAKAAMFGLDKEFKSTQCTLEELMGWLHEDYDRSSNLWSMPQTTALFVIFACLASLHASIASAFSLTHAYNNLVYEGWTPKVLEVDGANVVNVERSQFWSWIKDVWIPTFIRQDDFLPFDTDVPEDGLATNPFPGRLLRQNQVVAARLRRIDVPAEPCKIEQVWADIYDYDGGNCNLQSEAESIEDFFIVYHEKRELLQERIQNLSETWLIDNTSYLDLETLTYNMALDTFSFQKLRTQQEPSGYLKTKSRGYESWAGNPYSTWLIVLPDMMFVTIICSMMYFELKELLPAASNGLDGVADYWSFWNGVDWVAIIGGFMISGVWYNICLLVYNKLPEVLEGLPTDALDFVVFSNETYMTAEEVDKTIDRAAYEAQMANIFDMAEEVKWWHRFLRYMSVCYLFVLMLKFFKSFQANQRLNVVIETMTDSMVDVLHFFFSLVMVFACFALGAYVLWGYTVEPMGSFQKAFFFCWRDTVTVDDIGSFDLGMQAICYLWYFLFVILVKTLMASILVGLIMEAYGRVHSAGGDLPTIAQQIVEGVATIKDTSSYVDQYYIICELEDDDYPAHPDPLVTVRSLRKAFAKDKMTKVNAEYLIRKASQWGQDKAESYEAKVDDAVRMVAQVHVQSSRLLNMSGNIKNQVEAQYGKLFSEGKDKKPGQVALVEGENLSAPIELAPPQTKNTQLAADENLMFEELLLRKISELTNQISTIRSDQQQVVQRTVAEMEQQKNAVADKIMWAQQKITILKDRCERTEIGVGQLSECMKGIDVESLREMPDRLIELERKLFEANKPAILNKSHGNSARLDRQHDLLREHVDQLADKAGNSSVDLRQALRMVHGAIKQFGKEIDEG